MTLKAVSIDRCFDKFSDMFSPKIVGDVNGQEIKLARLEGDKVPWHTHDNEDEMFYVLDGTLDVLARDSSVTLHAGEFCIVKKGREHRCVPHGHVKLLLVESAGIAHTGDVRGEITKDRYDHLEA